MANTNSPFLIDNEKKWIRCYRIYEKYIINDPIEKFTKSFEDTKEMLEDKEELNVLLVGTASGEFESEFLEILLKKFRVIRAVVVEPSSDYIASFKELITKKFGDNITWSWNAMTLEGYLQQNEGFIVDSFDLITAAHCLCYTKNIKWALEHMMKSLKSNGIIYIRLDTEENICSNLTRDLPEIYAGNPRTNYTSEYIMSLSNDLDETWKTKVLATNYKYFDIELVYQTNPSEGALLLLFLTQRIDFHERAKEEMLKEYIKSKEVCCKDGVKRAPHFDQLFVIMK